MDAHLLKTANPYDTEGAYMAFAVAVHDNPQNGLLTCVG